MTIFGEWWGKIIFEPQYLPQFLNEVAEIFRSFRNLGGTLLF